MFNFSTNGVGSLAAEPPLSSTKSRGPSVSLTKSCGAVLAPLILRRPNSAPSRSIISSPVSSYCLVFYIWVSQGPPRRGVGQTGRTFLDLPRFTLFRGLTPPSKTLSGRATLENGQRTRIKPRMYQPLDMANGDPHNVIPIMLPRACELHKVTSRPGDVQPAGSCASRGCCPVSRSSLIWLFASLRTWLCDLESNVVGGCVDWCRIWVVLHISGGSSLESF
jgi:hypothetical protein